MLFTLHVHSKPHEFNKYLQHWLFDTKTYLIFFLKTEWAHDIISFLAFATNTFSDFQELPFPVLLKPLVPKTRCMINSLITN